MTAKETKSPGAGATTRATRPRVSDVVRWFAELAAAWGIAVVQPLLSLLGDSTDFFLSYGFSPIDVRLFVVVLTLVPPAAVWAVEMVVCKLPRVRARFHYAAVGLCTIVTLAQVAKTVLNLDGIDYVAVVALLSILALAGYLAWKPVREWLSYAALVPVLTVGLFVTSSASGRYAFAAEIPLATTTADSLDVPIVMLMLDEFPLSSLLDGTGAIDQVRFPNFARLASLSTWYRNYSSTSELTGYAIPSTLSGLKPRKGTSPTFVDHPNTLISLVRDSHKIEMSEALTNLCPPKACTAAQGDGSDATSTKRSWSGLLHGLVSVMRQRLDTTTVNEVDVFAARSTPDDVATTTPSSGENSANTAPNKLQLVASSQASTLAKWIDDLKPPSLGTRPVFNFLHVLFPHQKWMFLPDGSTYRAPGPEWTDDETPWEVKVRQQRHLLQVQYLDSLVGRLIDKLTSTGLLDKALVIVTADHGVSFIHGYHRRFAGGDFANATQLMHVPLFIRYPQQAEGEVDDSNLENVDVLPMLADKLNFEIPWKVDGIAPDKKSVEQSKTKTLYLIGRPLGGPPRSGATVTVSMSQFVSETLTWGFRGTQGNNDGPLDFLYSSGPYSTLIGRKISDLSTIPGPLSFALTDSRAWSQRPVQVVGTVSGNVTATEWFAFAIDGHLLGLSPTAGQGNSTVVTALLMTTASNANKLTVYRVVDETTLEVVSITR